MVSSFSVVSFAPKKKPVLLSAGAAVQFLKAGAFASGARGLSSFASSATQGTGLTSRSFLCTPQCRHARVEPSMACPSLSSRGRDPEQGTSKH